MFIDVDSQGAWEIAAEETEPAGAVSRSAAIGETKVPQSLDDLEQTVSRAYDMTLSKAVTMGIPVAGSMRGGDSRRVIVLERASFSVVERPDGVSEQWGYAIRFCATVNRRDADLRLSLPFLAASAELGHIEAQWMLHVIGLAGTEIDAASITPTDLDVETFVLAKQGLERLITAVRSEGTRFHAKRLARLTVQNNALSTYRTQVASAIAIGAIARGARLEKLEREFEDSMLLDHIRETYAAIQAQCDEDRVDAQLLAKSILDGARQRYLLR